MRSIVSAAKHTDQNDGRGGPERRTSVRIHQPCPVRVRGADSTGPFEETSVADDVGGGGLYVRLARRLAVGSALVGMVTLPTGARVHAEGHVLRVELRDEGAWGVAMQFATAALLEPEERRR